MSTLVSEPFVRSWAHDVHGTGRAEPRERHARTLAGLVAGAWTGVIATGASVCPVCGGNLVPLHAGARAEIVGGHCTDCGSTLG